jgi:hypothetical protein
MKLDDLYPTRLPYRKRFAERFWSKVDVRGPEECWLWLASVTKPTRRSPGGYGRFSTGKRTPASYTGAHRIAYMLHHGEVPDDLAVCHTCDNPPCCNPAHLWLGTKVENNSDRDRKGRTRNKPLPGSLNGRAKLTEADVLEARRLRKEGASFPELSRRYGVANTTICLAVEGKTWKRLVPLAGQEVEI